MLSCGRIRDARLTFRPDRSSVRPLGAEHRQPVASHLDDARLRERPVSLGQLETVAMLRHDPFSRLLGQQCQRSRVLGLSLVGRAEEVDVGLDFADHLVDLSEPDHCLAADAEPSRCCVESLATRQYRTRRTRHAGPPRLRASIPTAPVPAYKSAKTRPSITPCRMSKRGLPHPRQHRAGGCSRQRCQHATAVPACDYPHGTGPLADATVPPALAA